MDRNNVSLQARKQRRYAKLNAEIQQLTQNLTTLQGNLKTATDQLPALRNMASLHGSM
jgi:predicted  nucleic acid-binding Zn-ribbon protein